MDRRFKIKVWKDRLAGVYPPKWTWEVVDRGAGGKIVGCGTTSSETHSREAATRIVEQRRAFYEEQLAARSGTQLAWQASGPLVLRVTAAGLEV